MPKNNPKPESNPKDITHTIKKTTKKRETSYSLKNGQPKFDSNGVLTFTYNPSVDRNDFKNMLMVIKKTVTTKTETKTTKTDTVSGTNLGIFQEVPKSEKLNINYLLNDEATKSPKL